MEQAFQKPYTAQDEAAQRRILQEAEGIGEHAARRSQLEEAEARREIRRVEAEAAWRVRERDVPESLRNADRATREARRLAELEEFWKRLNIKSAPRNPQDPDVLGSVMPGAPVGCAPKTEPKNPAYEALHPRGCDGRWLAKNPLGPVGGGGGLTGLLGRLSAVPTPTTLELPAPLRAAQDALNDGTVNDLSDGQYRRLRQDLITEMAGLAIDVGREKQLLRKLNVLVTGDKRWTKPPLSNVEEARLRDYISRENRHGSIEYALDEMTKVRLSRPYLSPEEEVLRRLKPILP